MSFTLILADKKTLEFKTAAAANKAARAAGGTRISPSKQHKGITYFMSPNGELAVRKNR